MPKSSATGATNSANDIFVGGSGLLIDGGGGPRKPVRVDKLIISEHKHTGLACIKSQPDFQNPGIIL
jgi:hypothetical protein